MRLYRFVIFGFVAILISSGVWADALPDKNSFNVLKRVLEIDTSLPLNAQVSKVENFATYTRETVIFDGFDRERANGFLAIPKKAKNPPVVILLHGITQSKKQWWAEGGPFSFPSAHRERLLNNGFAVFALDARDHGDRIQKNDFENPYTYIEKYYVNGIRDLIFNSAKDVKRAIDYLQTRTDIDADRIGVMGFSLGGSIGWIVAATDSRVKSFVSMGAPAGQWGPVKWDIFNPLQFAPGINENLPVLIIAAEEDTWYTADDVKTLLGITPAKIKELKYYPGGHDLPTTTADATIPWMKKYL